VFRCESGAVRGSRERSMFDYNLYARMVRAAWKSLGPREALPTLGFPVYSAFTHLTMALDPLLYPDLDDVEVEKPVFILGHPRSGTTFFHRLMTQTNEFPVFELWELLVPSLAARRVVAPIVDKVGASFRQKMYFNQDAVFSDGAHDTSAHSVEEEELLFGFKLDTQMFTFLTPLGFDEDDWVEVVFNDHQPAARRKASTRFLRECFKRHLRATGLKQILAKMPYSTLRIKSLLEEFPDARIVYLVRSPYETIPSHLSLHRSFFANRWGLENIDPGALERYYQRRYRHNVDLYRYFYDLQKSGELPEDQVMVVRYDHLVKDLERVFHEVVDFTGLQVSDELVERVRKQAEKQKSWKRKHRNLALEEFGLSKERIAKDLDFVFEAYGFPK